MKKRALPGEKSSALLPAQTNSFVFELNRLSREIDSALLARAGGVALASAAALGLGFMPAPALAATFTVDNTTDGNDGSCADGDCSLREAVAEANAVAGADTVDASAISGTITLVNGQMAAYGPVTIAGPGSGNLTIDADYGSRHFFFYSGSGNPISLSGVTLVNGYSGSEGGAIYGANCQLTLDDIVANNNESYDEGGAVYCGDYIVGADLNLTVTDSSFSDNYAGGDGGALGAYTEGYLTLDITDTNFTGNGTDGGGGALYAESAGAGGSIQISNASFTGNIADDEGGGVHLSLESSSGDPIGVSIAESTFSGNITDDQGGGLYLYTEQDTGTSTVTLDNNQFTNNHAYDEGGGAYVYQDLDNDGYIAEVASFNTTLTGNQFTGNQADFGGGLYLYVGPDEGDGSATLVGNQFTGNQAARHGGGVFLAFDVDEDYGSAQVSLTDTTITGNLAGLTTYNNTDYQSGGSGGGIFVAPSFYGDAVVSITGGAISNNTAYAYTDYFDGGGSLRRARVGDKAGEAEGGPKGGPGGSYCGAFGGYGGGLALCQGKYADTSLSGVTISGNQAQRGTVPTPEYCSAEPTAYFCEYIAGTEHGGLGGGVFVSSPYGKYEGSYQLALDEVTVSGNSAGLVGGVALAPAPGEFSGSQQFKARLAWRPAGDVLLGKRRAAAGGSKGIGSLSTVTISNSTISGNTVPAGTGVYGTAGGLSAYLEYARLELINSTISGNTGDTAGGLAVAGYSGIAAKREKGVAVPSVSVSLIHTTVADNTAAAGPGGIYTYGLPVGIYNSIVSNPGEVDLAEGYGDFGLFSSLVTDPGATSYYDGGGNIVGQDPLLGPLADNGGPTQTQALDFTSPAFDAGSATHSSGLAYDQRGTPYAREVFSAPDMGAYEFQGPVPVTLAIAPDPASLNEDGSNSATISACLPTGFNALEDVDVSLGVTGTATPGSDHDLGDGTVVTIPTGSECGTVVVTAIQDTENEVDSESVLVDITAVNSTSGNFAEDGTQQVSATVVDDEVGPPPGPSVAVVSVSLSVTSLQEENPAAKSAHSSELTVTLDAPAPGEVSISLGFSGEAQLGTDFSVTGNPIIIPLGETQGTAQVTAIADTEVEGDEPFTATVTAATCTPNCSVQIPDPPPSAEGVIVDDDQALEEPAAPIPALGPLGLLLLPLLIPIAGWRYWRKRWV